MTDEMVLICPLCKSDVPFSINKAVTLTGHYEDDHRLSGLPMMLAVTRDEPRAQLARVGGDRRG